MELSNFCFWCYKCNSYVFDESLKGVKELFENKKRLQQLYSEISLLENDNKEEEKKSVAQNKESTGVKSVVGSVCTNNELNDPETLSERFFGLFSDSESHKAIPEETEGNIEISVDNSEDIQSEEEVTYKDPEVVKAEKGVLIKRIAGGEFKKIVVMTGAGISVNAGIPDFRTPGTGLYSQLAKYNLPYPEAVFSLGYFATNPKPFYQLAKEMFHKKYLPTKTHYFIRFLQSKNLLLRNYTQNIDNLEVEAGINKELLRQVHGTPTHGHCINCRIEVSETEIMQAMNKGEPMYCKYCNSPCKPDIVFFGEGLPKEAIETIEEVKTECDLLIIMGSSLTVLPFCAFPLFSPKHVPRLVINNELPKIFERVEGLNYVFMKGDCDKNIQELVNSLGWDKEFNELLKLREEYKKRYNL